MDPQGSQFAWQPGWSDGIARPEQVTQCKSAFIALARIKASDSSQNLRLYLLRDNRLALMLVGIGLI